MKITIEIPDSPRQEAKEKLKSKEEEVQTQGDAS